MTQPHAPKPVFFTTSDKRWRRFRGAARLIGIVLILLLIVAGVAVLRESATILPALGESGEIYTKILNPDKVGTFKTRQNLDYQRFRKSLGNKAEFEYNRTHAKRTRPDAPSKRRGSVQIRGGFYVNWDAESFISLRDHISEMNMVFPEWMALPDSGDTVVSSIDARALAVMRDNNVSIVPMVTNYFGEQWNTKNIDRILSRESSRHNCIQSILQALE